MNAPAILADGLWKEYRIGGRRRPTSSLRDLLAAAPLRIVRRMRGATEESEPSRFWALRNVSFEVNSGEAVGIIGPNGAGKSTLLKILSRITEPTRGRAEIRGRVASLLEVGTGFHPELTGHDNIFLNGTILGMSRRDIRQRFDAIVDFAGVERFLETPVKHFSSGMYVRLAFAVAAHLEPDILIVDEVLAVGDAAFQRKCLDRMADAARSGRTVVFVSHHLGMIGRLCQRAVLLEGGAVKTTGPVSDVIESYVTGLEDPGGLAESQTATPSGDKEARLDGAYSASCEGRESSTFPHDASVDLAFRVSLQAAAHDLLLSVTVCQRRSRQAVFTSQIPSLRNGSGPFTGSYRARMRIPAHTLTPGEYACDIGVVTPYGHIVDVLYQACPFTVMDVGSPLAQYEGRDYGVVFVACEWSLGSQTSGDE